MSAHGSLIAAMQIGLIGCGNMARALARGWGRPVLAPTRCPSAPQALAAEVGGEALAEQRRGRRSAPTSSCSATSPPSSTRSRRGRAAREGGRLDPRRHAAGGAEGRLPRQPVYRFMPSLPVEVRQGAVVQADGPAPGRRSRRAGPRPVRRARHARRARRRARRRRHGPDVLRARLRRARRRGADRRRRAPRHPRRPRRRAGRPDAAGTAELLRRRGNDTLAVRREVTSPGGVTAARPRRARASRSARRLQRRPRRRARGEP